MVTYADRVEETFTTTGTGSISLGGAVTGFQAFSAVLSNGGTCYYAATDGTNWEIGEGTYATSGDVLARTSILASSNSGSAVNWAAGTKSIFMTLPASAIAGFSSSLTIGSTPISGGTSGYILSNSGGNVSQIAPTGSGNVVLANSPALVTPALGTPASGNLSNCTGFPAGLMTALAVGSIISAKCNSAVNTAAGGTIAAASLATYVFNTTTNAFVTGSDTLSGTWQALQNNNNAGNNGFISPWQRVA